MDLNKTHAGYIAETVTIDELFGACLKQAKIWLASYVSDPEDSAQEAAIRAWTKLDTFDSTKGSFKSWFFMIVKSVKVDSLRIRYSDKQKLEQYKTMLTLAEDESETFLDESSLSDLQKDIVDLAVQGFSSRDVQDKLNVSRQTYRTAIKNMRQPNQIHSTGSN